MPRPSARSPFGKELAKIRVNHDLTPPDMAGDLDISTSALRSYDTGARPAPLWLVVKVRTVYGVDLLGLYAPPDPSASSVDLSALPRQESDFVCAVVEGLVRVPEKFDLAAVRSRTGPRIH